MLDRLAPVRQAQWDAAMATLREIDPGNPNLTEVATPGSAPSQAALDRLEAAVKAAAIRRVADRVMPGGVPIGVVGSSPDIAVLPGGEKAATELFSYLQVGTKPYDSDSSKTIVQLPQNGGFLTLRPRSRSGAPAIDINVLGITLKRIHFRWERDGCPRPFH